MNLDRMMERQRLRNPNKIDMKIKLFQFLVTRLGLFVSWLASFVVAFLLAQLVKIGVELNGEVEGALILGLNQVLWGLLIWAVRTFEVPYKKELQELLGTVTIDGLIGPQVVKRAEVVMNYAHSSTSLPPEKP
jgi:hypothetical protein